jgi:hypothetical protein
LLPTVSGGRVIALDVDDVSSSPPLDGDGGLPSP